jgi:ribosomal protein S18 acetylase RimI-like enzyme
MDLEFQYSCSGIDWNLVLEILKRAGLSYYDSDIHKKAFENSQVVIFAFDNGKLIGFGRAISDGICDAAIYDVAILPEYQRKLIGSRIVRYILEQLSGCDVILFSTPGTEPFYEKFHFRKMITGMALFKDAEEKVKTGYIE